MNTTKPEIVQLLRRINEGATNSQTPLGDVMRLCLRMGSLLGNKELSDWAKAEAGGYDDRNNLPDYRIFETEVRGTFSGPFGSGIENAIIPQLFVEKEHREMLFTVYMTQAIGELERLAIGRSDSNSITVSWPGDVIAYYQRKELYQGHTLLAAWKVMTTTLIVGILDTIRTRVLEFVLIIEKDIGIDAMNYDDSKKPVEPPSQEKIHQTFHTTIMGGTSIALGNTGTTNQYATNVQPGDLQSLKEKLAQLGVPDKLITDLDTALDEDADSHKQPGPHVQSWFSRLMIKVGKGTIQLASTAATTIVMAEVKRYLGLPLA